MCTEHWQEYVSACRAEQVITDGRMLRITWGVHGVRGAGVHGCSWCRNEWCPPHCTSCRTYTCYMVYKVYVHGTRCTYTVHGVLPIALSALQFDIHDIVASPDSITGEAIQLCGSK